MKKLVLLMLYFLFFSACSVGMAMSGKQEPNLGIVKIGVTRGEVEIQLGPPITSNTLEDGTRVDIYEYEVGNEPSAGRAIAHGAMDVLTLGLWEIIGTPIERLQGEKKEITITYDSNDKVISVKSYLHYRYRR